MRLPRPRRYGTLARYYDQLSGEVVYRPGRLAAIEALRLRSGERVLDVGCGTGLNFPYLVEAVGRGGAVVGIDASPAMLARARHRISTHEWPQVTLVRGDAGAAASLVDGPFDAALFTYSLAIIDGWRSSWRQVLGLVRAGGRVAVVDTAAPTGVWAPLAPVTWPVFAVGGVHPSRRVWQLVVTDTQDSEQLSMLGGHVRMAAGTVLDVDPAAGPTPAGVDR